MKLFWTNTAIRTYQKYADDPQVRGTFKDLIRFITDDPTRGTRVVDLLDHDDPWHARAAVALRDLPLPTEARFVFGALPPVNGARPRPPVLALAVHTPEVPKGSHADHTILMLEVLLRQHA